jgi:pyruvate dehydrogenase E2 component (dihydrolipoamide acetyltransferase)
VKKGEPVLEIESDKATLEVEAEATGVLLATLFADGTVVPVTETIGWIGEAGEAVPAQGTNAIAPTAAQAPAEAPRAATELQAPRPEAAASAAEAAPPRPAATPAARRMAWERGLDLSALPGTGPFGAVRAADVKTAGARMPASDLAGTAKRPQASPLAGKLARMRSVDLAGVRGSGPGGRILKADLPAGPARDEEVLVPLSRIQQLTGRRMVQSHSDIPAVTLHGRCDVSRLAALREELNAGGERRLTYNDFVLRAVALTLPKHPFLNAVYQEQSLALKKRINLGMAVAGPSGLVVAVLRDAAHLPLMELSRAARELAGKARENRLSPDELSGGTFTVSNIGMYGVFYFTPIINPPQVAILGVGSIEEEPALSGGRLVMRKVMGLSLSFDHRAMDGVQPAACLGELRRVLESPSLLLLP